jgi:alanine racemase
VIKGDAYGHGIEIFSRLASFLQLARVCVVENWEAAVVRHDTQNPGARELDVIRVRSAKADDYYYTVDLSMFLSRMKNRIYCNFPIVFP